MPSGCWVGDAARGGCAARVDSPRSRSPPGSTIGRLTGSSDISVSLVPWVTAQQRQQHLLHGHTLVHDLGDVLGDGHGDVVLAGELEDGAARLDALRGL